MTGPKFWCWLHIEDGDRIDLHGSVDQIVGVLRMVAHHDRIVKARVNLQESLDRRRQTTIFAESDPEGIDPARIEQILRERDQTRKAL